MRAAVRPHSREVSTSSATITQVGCFLASADPGKMAKRALRAPWIGAGPSLRPMWESSPDSTAWWMWSGSPASWLIVTPAPRAAWRSWEARSCHSRMRR